MIEDGFTFEDAEIVVAIYVCAQCEGKLEIIQEWYIDDLFFVVCPDCGNVERVGRISKTTVAIRNERGIWEYPVAIRALEDLWGHLIATKKDREAIIHTLGY